MAASMQVLMAWGAFSPIHDVLKKTLFPIAMGGAVSKPKRLATSSGTIRTSQPISDCLSVGVKHVHGPIQYRRLVCLGQTKLQRCPAYLTPVHLETPVPSSQLLRRTWPTLDFATPDAGIAGASRTCPTSQMHVTTSHTDPGIAGASPKSTTCRAANLRAHPDPNGCPDRRQPSPNQPA